MLISYISVGILVIFILALAGLILNMRNKLEDFRKREQEAKTNGSDIVSNISNQIQILSQNFSQNLGTIQKSVDQRLGENTNRLDNAARSYGEVQKQLAHLQGEVKRVHEVGKDISSLHEILRAPKVRGVMGEIWLDKLLSQMLPRDHFESQHSFKSGEKVDAVIRLQNYLISVDSKFPLENFKKATESQDEEEKKGLKKQFAMDVKKHINSISQKYILPDEGTMDFALMYIPAENVYYEIISHNFGNINIFDYAFEKKVIPVSPNSFYAYLGTISKGLKGLQIEENAKVILENLKRLEIEFGKVRSDFVLLGSHLNNAAKKYSDTEKRLDRFENRLEKSKAKELDEPEESKLIEKGEVKI
ncbi:MAG: DNA recombination protein RmuC [Parcubacteria group bacterium]|jgi:DNA recombination protein RmuC